MLRESVFLYLAMLDLMHLRKHGVLQHLLQCCLRKVQSSLLQELLPQLDMAAIFCLGSSWTNRNVSFFFGKTIRVQVVFSHGGAQYCIYF